jgi:hypothetical protein
MKRTLRLAGCCVLIGAGISTAPGDTPPAKPVKTPPAVSPTTGAVIAAPSDTLETLPAIASPAKPSIVPSSVDEVTADPGAIDFSTTDPEEIARQTLRMRQENKDQPDIDGEAWKQRQKEELEEHDWMLRGYQEQLRKNGLDKTPAPPPDPYAPVTRDRDGNPSDDLLNDPLLQTYPPPRKIRPPDNNPAPPGTDKSLSASLSPFSVQPLLPPQISSDNTTGAHPDNFTGNLQSDSNSPASAMGPAIPPQPGDSSILDIPGMTAAQEGLPPGDLSLQDRLPDEPSDVVKPHDDQNNFLPPIVPLNDVDAFYKKQAASLQPPNAPTFRALVTPPVVVNAYKEPQPTAKPAVSGLRTHIADPFDFLNRPHGGGE